MNIINFPRLCAFLLMSCLVLVITACMTPPSPEPIGTPVIFVTPTPSATATPLFSPTPTISPTPSQTPTQTLTPTQTPTQTPTPNLTPHAIIASPNQVLNVRRGPGTVFDPPLGAYENGLLVDLIGRQYDGVGDLWWVISFAGQQGWIYAPMTEAQNIDNLPWITAPPTPTPTYVSPTPTLVPQAVINSLDGFVQVKRGPGLAFDPPWGAYNNGAVVFLLGKQYSADGSLWWQIPFEASATGAGWIQADLTLPQNGESVPWVNVATPTPGLPAPSPLLPTPTPRLYSTTVPQPSAVPIPPTAAPQPPENAVIWAISGRVIDAETTVPLSDVQVTAILGQAAFTIQAVTDPNGLFNLTGQALDQGPLTLKLVANEYQATEYTFAPSSPRIYTLDNLAMTFVVRPCLYESVVDLTSDWASARLQSLGFTNIRTSLVELPADSPLIDIVISQSPNPPQDSAQVVPLDCKTEIVLEIGGTS